MKLNRIIASVSAFAMAASLVVSSATIASAAEGYKVTLDFAGYETKGKATFAKVNVNLEVPDTLKKYEVIPADWDTTFEDEYSGFAVQGLSIEVPKVDGLQFIKSQSTFYAPFTDGTDGAASVKLVYVNTGAYDTYYADPLNKTLATLAYRITGDIDATYELTASDVVLKYTSWSGTDSKYTGIEYTFGDFTIAGATIKPESSDIPVEAIKLDQTAVELDLNGTKTAILTATVEPADATDPTVTWTSSDENIATVVDGVVTAVATGEATITATAGEKSATCVVTVVDTTPKTLKPGDVIEGIDIAKNPGKEDNVFYYVKTVEDGANAAGHAKITNVTLGESVTTSRTIAQLLGGEAAEGATIEGAIVVVISGPVGNAFDFEIVD